MATRKPDASTERGNTKQSGKKQNASAADFEKMAKEAEMDSPRSRKPGSSSGNKSEQHNNGRGGGK